MRGETPEDAPALVNLVGRRCVGRDVEVDGNCAFGRRWWGDCDLGIDLRANEWFRRCWRFFRNR